MRPERIFAAIGFALVTFGIAAPFLPARADTVEQPDDGCGPAGFPGRSASSTDQSQTDVTKTGELKSAIEDRGDERLA